MANGPFATAANPLTLRRFWGRSGHGAISARSESVAMGAGDVDNMRKYAMELVALVPDVILAKSVMRHARWRGRAAGSSGRSSYRRTPRIGAHGSITCGAVVSMQQNLTPKRSNQ